MFSNIYSLSYLSIKVGGLCITSEIYPKGKNRIGLVSLGCFNVINSYPPFGCHAKKGIDNLPLHPFTLPLVEVPVRTNDHQFDRSSGMFYAWVLR